MPLSNYLREVKNGRARDRGVRLTLGWGQADVGLEELAAAGGLLDAVGQRLADLPDAQVEELRHGERAHHHLGGRPRHAQPCWLTGRGAADLAAPLPPAGGPCVAA